MTSSKFNLYEIAVYWSKVSSGYLDELHNDLHVLSIMNIDLSNPGCFACGYARHNPKKVEGKKPEHLWKSSKLERHHMHPISLGGRDEIDNIFLLCKDCHLDVPHVQMNLKEMINWSHSRESNTMQVFNKIIESFDKIKTMPVHRTIQTLVR